MREYERAILLERIERDGATVGAEIPAEVEVDGEPIALRSAVIELTTGELDDETRDRAADLARGLRGTRRTLRERLESPETSLEEGEAIVETIAGIDRALNALTTLDAPSVQEAADRRKREDQRRWLSFLKEALGQEEDRSR